MITHRGPGRLKAARVSGFSNAQVLNRMNRMLPLLP